MSTEAQAAGGAAATTTEQGTLLDQVLTATKSTTEKSQAEDMIRSLTEEALKGTVTWSKNLTKTLQDAVIRIDMAMSKQLTAVLRAPELQKLEGSWRGLHHLVMNSETGAGLKLKVMNITKKDLYKDLAKAVEFDQSQTFKKLYENEFGTPGGEPYGALIGDYEIANHPDDVELMEKMSNVAAASFCPFITAAGPKLFGFEGWEELSKPRDLEKIFEGTDYVKWRSFRDSEDARFTTLVMPRVL
ncbi:MAG TPA: type VI secretion system contractile sheath large subunit, partial [Gemmataceae bacterium]|nr:type VI secretion system contractile sheath large subunit [Gemmataceae bacterium]